MNLTRHLEESECFAAEIFEIVADAPIPSVPQRVSAAADEAILSLEHWRSIGTLLRQGNIPSALAVQLAQLNAVTQSMWLTHVATDVEVAEFGLYQSLAPDQVTSVKVPHIKDMMGRLSESAPRSPYLVVSSAREARWTYSRSELYRGWRNRQEAEGLAIALLYSSNAVGALGCLLTAALVGDPYLQQQVRAVVARYPTCMAQHQSKWLDGL